MKPEVLNMAIDLKEFPNDVDVGLKANRDYTKFFYRFKIDGITKRGIIDYSLKDWDKRTRIVGAKAELLNKRKDDSSSNVNFTENSTLDSAADIYFSIAYGNSVEWAKERLAAYNLYCRNGIGKKKIKDIKLTDIDKLRNSMQLKGHSKQTENGCSPRTIKKVLLQSLKPILQYALDNKVINDIPKFNLPKSTHRKKLVTHASQKLSTLYSVITTRYAEDPFYKALFLFALYGRRWNEIRTLTWNDIDVLNKTYTIRAQNNKIGVDQSYELPKPILESLLKFEDTDNHLVFKSPITGEELYTPKKQLSHIQNDANMPELTMHYFRHILVSAMGEMGTATTILSAALGHTNLQTVNDFYLSANHMKASSETNQTIDKLLEQND
jgi:integrase